MAGISKVVYGESTLIDLTADTITADVLKVGCTAHDAAGNPITGTLAFAAVHTGSGTPSASAGADGDIYLEV